MARPHRSTRIIQIIPSVGWMLEYKENDGTKTRCQSACFALHSDGEIVLMDIGVDGQSFEAAEMDNFVRCYYDGIA